MTTTMPHEAGLTPELLAEICPIARSDRRKYGDLFDDFTSKEDLIDETQFYSALLERIRTDEAFIQRLQDRFWSSKPGKNKKKSFLIRSCRWLSQKAGEDINPVAVVDLSDDLFPEHSPEQELLSLCKSIFVTSADDEHDSELSTVDWAKDADWQLTRDRMCAMLKELEFPDPERAAKICDEAVELLAACEAVAKKTGEEAKLNTLRAELADQLVSALESTEGHRTIFWDLCRGHFCAWNVL